MVERVGSDLHVRETIGRRRPSRKRWKRRERERWCRGCATPHRHCPLRLLGLWQPGREVVRRNWWWAVVGGRANGLEGRPSRQIGSNVGARFFSASLTSAFLNYNPILIISLFKDCSLQVGVPRPTESSS
jgi:hypothetical protein